MTKLTLATIAEKLAKERPETKFEGYFFDVKEKIKNLKKKMFEAAKDKVSKELSADLKNMGIEIIKGQLKLGQFRGSFYITSARLELHLNKVHPAALEKKLQHNYSPKFKFKGIEDGIAVYNVR